MVDVAAKPETERTARAEAAVTMAPATLAAIRDERVPKGDVVATARLAGIMAAKRTARAHPAVSPAVAVVCGRRDRGRRGPARPAGDHRDAPDRAHGGRDGGARRPPRWPLSRSTTCARRSTAASRSAACACSKSRAERAATGAAERTLDERTAAARFGRLGQCGRGEGRAQGARKPRSASWPRMASKATATPVHGTAR